MSVIITRLVNFILDIEECASSPCQNGGTCNDRVNKYTCTCDFGYLDINCEKGRSCLRVFCILSSDV